MLKNISGLFTSTAMVLILMGCAEHSGVEPETKHPTSAASNNNELPKKCFELEGVEESDSRWIPKEDVVVCP